MNILTFLLAFTWELPQSLFALICMIVLKAEKYENKKGRLCLVFKNSVFASFSLGEFIFFNERNIGIYNWETTQNHEFGHSRQSRILGPLYLVFIGLPSVIWNLIARRNNWFYEHYYDTPWEHTADLLGKVNRKTLA